MLQHVQGRHLSISTAFSGVLTPELSLRLWCSATDAFCKANHAHHGGMTLRPVFAVEKARQCQEEILGQHDEHTPEHVFDDQFSFIQEDARKFCDIKPTPSASSIRERILGATCNSGAWCVRHGKCCVAERAHIHVAGSHCTDHSTMNQNRQGLDGDKNKFFWAWSRHRLKLLEPCWVHENVKAFGVEPLVQDLGSAYDIVRIVLCSTALGWASRRVRQFVVGIHKGFRNQFPQPLPHAGLNQLEGFVYAFFGRQCGFNRGSGHATGRR